MINDQSHLLRLIHSLFKYKDYKLFQYCIHTQQLMIQHYFYSALQKINLFKDYFFKSTNKKQLFQCFQQHMYSPHEIFHALKFAAGSNATDYSSFHQIHKYLHAILYYINSEKNLFASQNGIEHLLNSEEQSVHMTSKYVLVLYIKFLQKVVPTNITYYHFMRQKDLYMHYTAIKYILTVGYACNINGSNRSEIFSKIKTQQKVNFYLLFLRWLFKLISYKNSAIYLQSLSIDELIQSTYMVLNVLLQSGLTDTIYKIMDQLTINQSFNQHLYISTYLLCKLLNHRTHVEGSFQLKRPFKKKLFNIILMVIRKLFCNNLKQNITHFIPSYLYASFTGFIQQPYTQEIIVRLILYYLSGEYALQQKVHTQKHIQSTLKKDQEQKDRKISIHQFHDVENQQHKKQSEINENEQCDVDKFIELQCWNVLTIILEEQTTMQTNEIIKLIRFKIQHTKPSSIIRAFLVKIIHILHLDLIEEVFRSYTVSNKEPFLIKGKVIEIKTICKNVTHVFEEMYKMFFISMRKVDEAIYSQEKIWRKILEFNKFQIHDKADYDQIMKRRNEGGQT